MPRQREVSDEGLLRFFIESPYPVLGTGEVAKKAGYENQHATRRLNELKERGYLKNHKVGRVLVWWITYDGREFVLDDC